MHIVVCVCACVRACVRASERACVCACVCVCVISKYVTIRSTFKKVQCSVNVQNVHVLCERGQGLKTNFPVLVHEHTRMERLISKGDQVYVVSDYATRVFVVVLFLHCLSAN